MSVNPVGSSRCLYHFIKIIWIDEISFYDEFYFLLFTIYSIIRISKGYASLSHYAKGGLYKGLYNSLFV